VLGVPRSRSGSPPFPLDAHVRSAGYSTPTRGRGRTALVRLVWGGSPWPPPRSRRGPRPDRPGAPKSKFLSPEPLSGYKLRLRYADGVAGEVDLSHLVGKGVFRLWSDPEAFRHVSVGSGGEVCWSDDVDLCADALYLEMTGKRPEDVFPTLRKVTIRA
jgi:hypothetical protein